MNVYHGCELLHLRIDLHTHTNYSYDSLITPEELVFHAKKRGLDGVAVTDHDRIDGALKTAKETRDFLILPGIEVSSLDGHIIGLNVHETIPRKLSIEETVDKIHEAGGIAIACHPAAFFKGSLRRENISSKFDALEVMNASAFPFGNSVKHAREIALSLQIAQVGGSDAHYGPEIGCAYTVVDSESKIDQIIKAIRDQSCQPFGNAIPFTTRLKRELLSRKRGFI